MSAAATDKFLKTGLPGTAASLAAPGYTIGDSSITISSSTDWPTDTGVVFGIDVAEIVNSQEVRMDGSYCVFSGVVTSGTVISNLSLEYGTPQNYAAGALTRVYITISTIHNERLIDGILAEHKQTGAHSDVHADTVTVTGVTTLDDVVIGGNLTIAGNTDAAGWSPLGATPNTITDNGNGSYSVVFNSVDITSTVSRGMPLKFTRTVSAPTQCASLNGSNQYFSKSGPAGTAFTDDFVVSAWVKLSSYNPGSIISRYNGTSGFDFSINGNGQVQLIGFNASSSNFSQVASYCAIPLNEWVHVAAQLDMSSFTATSTTSYVMVSGADVSAAVTRGGTNPTALVQAGNLEVGGRNGGLLPFPGKIAQVALFSAKVTQATVRSYRSQTFAGTETSLISAYSLNNSLSDLNANANNLTAQNSAATTNADSPFTQDDGGVPSGTTDFGKVVDKTFSTNTTLVVYAPEGCAIPTSGGISSIRYSPHKSPFGYPQRSTERIRALVTVSQSGAGATPTQVSGLSITLTTLAKRYRLTAYARDIIQNTGFAYCHWQIWDGVVNSGTLLEETQPYAAASSASAPAYASFEFTPTPGTHTYNVGMTTSTSTVGTECALTYPAYLTIEPVYN